MNETADSAGRIIANLIVVILKNEPTNCYLLNCKVFNQNNHSTIAQFFNFSMVLLYGNEMKYENILLLITDVATSMIKVGKASKTFCRKMINLTCLAHGLHRVSEEIRALHSEVDQLISNVKNIFKSTIKNINLQAKNT